MKKQTEPFNTFVSYIIGQVVYQLCDQYTFASKDSRCVILGFTGDNTDCEFNQIN